MAAAPLTLQRLRRDRLLIWLWLPIGGLAFFAFMAVWRHVAGEPPQRVVMVADIVWIAVTFSLIARRTTRRCPQCNNRWLRSFPWMSMKKIQCGVCGHEMPEH